MVFNPELVEERLAALIPQGLVERPRWAVVRPGEEADPGEAELASEVNGRSHQRTPDPAAAVLGEDVQLVEVEEADALVELRNSDGDTESDRAGASVSDQEPDRVRRERVVAIQACCHPAWRKSGSLRVVRMVLGLDPRDQQLEIGTLPLGGADDRDVARGVFGHGETIPQPSRDRKGDHRWGTVYSVSGGAVMPSFPRFLFRVKDRQIEEEARTMVGAFDIKDIEIRRDDTIKDAWLEDSVALKTTFGLEDIREYLENLTGK